MSFSLQELKKWYDAHLNKIIDDYLAFLRFRSISTDPSYLNESLACAEFLVQFIKKLGMKAELIATSGMPLVYGEDLSLGKNAPTLLIYGHYDVQPVDPIELWKHDPFDPKIEADVVYARGAQDNKGQIFYTLCAIKALFELQKKLPVNLKICIEGEEESASTGLMHILPKIKDKLAADAVLVPDFDIPAKDSPAIVLGVRGIMTLEMILTGSKSDLHSGQFGGIAFNPNRALVHLLSKLWNENGRVMVPGFYDDIQNLSEEEKKTFATESSGELYQKEWGIAAFANEKNYSLTESNWFRPTLEINGIGGGYFGKGFKTVIPAKAVAKISCRLVPNQDPHKIYVSLKKFLEQNVIKGIKIEIADFGSGKPVRNTGESPLANAVMHAYQEVFQKPCKRGFTGSSVPIIADIVHALKSDIAMMGMGLDSDCIHAPNEHFSLDRFEKGFLVMVRTLQLFGEKKYV